jgi:putative SOS response-associated peptidase YedK
MLDNFWPSFDFPPMYGCYRDTRPWAQLNAAPRQFVGPFDQPALNLEAREQVRPTQVAAIVRLLNAVPSVSQTSWWIVPWLHKGALKHCEPESKFAFLVLGNETLAHTILLPLAAASSAVLSHKF